MDAVRQPPTVLVVDDDHGLLRLIEKVLRREGCATATAASGQGARQWISQHQADLMLLDLKLPDLEGSQLVGELARLSNCPPFIIITGQGDERVAVEMMKRGARDYLVKDADFLEFVPSVVKRALEQIENERRLALAEEQVHLIRRVVEQGFSAVLITNAELPDPRVVYINPAFAHATGYVPDQVIGQPLSSLASLASVHQLLRGGLPRDATFLDAVSTYQTAQGECWGEWRLGPVEDKTGKTSHWLIIFRDITERKRLEKELLEISDRERRRLGQDLHDGLCQHLAGIELMSQVLEQKLQRKSKTDAARAAEIARHVRDAIGQTRALARGLSPVTLESEGLSSALRELASNTEKMFGVTCRVVLPGAVPPQSLAVSTHLYRIAQEAVSNAIKHGKAKNIEIQLQAGDEGTLLRVSDNGSGFPGGQPGSRGMGVRIMHYRAGMIGGQISFQNSSGGGATVSCALAAPSAVHPAPPPTPQS